MHLLDLKPIHSTYSYCLPYCQSTLDLLKPPIKGIKNGLKDAEAFQRICQVAIAIIESINLISGKNYLSKLIVKLDSANIDDMYEFLTIPYDRLYTINVSRIDEKNLLVDLEKYLRPHISKNSESMSTIRDIAKRSLAHLLNYMSEHDVSFRYEDDFKRHLSASIIHNARNEINNALAITPASLPPITLKKTPLLEWISEFNFSLVKIGYVPLFLQDWEVINLGYIAKVMGDYPVLNLIASRSLEYWVRLGLCQGFLFKFLESCRLLMNSDPDSSITRPMILWNIVFSSTEFIFNFVLLQQGGVPLVLACTLITKSIGVFCILFKPSPVFFPELEESSNV